MATSKYTQVTIELESLLKKSPRNSESQNAIACGKALAIVRNSELSDDDKKAVLSAINRTANPTGFYYENNGIQAGLEAITALMQQSEAVEPTAEVESVEKVADSAVQPVTEQAVTPAPAIRFNRKNLNNLVSNGAIFSVEFIKRSNGELRKMVCRLGVKKHLRGGGKAYDASKHNLLTVFDMEKEGYRSIPVDAIQRLSVNGQTFTFSA